MNAAKKAGHKNVKVEFVEGEGWHLKTDQLPLAILGLRLGSALDFIRHPSFAVKEEIITLTYHADKRLKQRLGLCVAARRRHVKTVFDKGFRHDQAKGRLKDYFDKTYLNKKTANNIRIYGEFIYIFSGNCLITVYELPDYFKNIYKKQVARYDGK